MSVPDLTFKATISCRKDAVGGDVIPVRILTAFGDSADITGLETFILLIHGFNDTQRFADCAYRQFLALLSAQLKASPNVVRFFWPGDQTSKIKSTLDYPAAQSKCMESAQCLADFLHAHARTLPPSSGGLQLDVVAHSLGNRVLLEAFKILRANNAPVHIRSCSLMAAAVLTASIENADGSPQSLWAEAASIGHAAVMSSTGDDVLRLAFPAGETLACEGFFPQAVGRFGNPSGVIWQYHGTFNQFGHSDYWVSPDAAQFVAAAMNYGVPRTTPNSDLAVNTAGTIRVTATNFIASNQLGLSGSSPCKEL